MTFEEIIKDLKNRVYKPVYFLHGEEPYYIDRISDYIEAHVLNDMEKEFNQTVLYGRDTDVLSLTGMCKRFPMMSNYQVVVVKEAQDIKNLISKSEDDDNNPLISYLKAPQKSTLLVLCYKYKTIDKRTKLAKQLVKYSEFFDSKKLYDNQLPQWIMNYSATHGYKTDERAAMLMSEYIGNDLSRLANEIDKLCINIDTKTIIDTKLVEKYIGISKEFNVFELQNAIGTKNILKANRIANFFAANTKNNPLVLTLGNLSGFFNKLMMYHLLQDKNEKLVASILGVHPFFVKDYSKAASNYHPNKLIEIFSLLREYDMRSKGVNNESAVEGGPLKRISLQNSSLMSSNKVRVSVVSYLNSQPFLIGLQKSEISNSIELSSDIPSVCAQKLIDDRADIGLIPVASLREIQNAEIISDYCIGASGNVDSVLLLSEVPLAEIKTILLDYQSRTSVELVKILSEKYWKIYPVFENSEEGYEQKINNTTAALVIGNRALQMKNKYAFVYDLAGEWKKYSGLPFVFACWVSNKKMSNHFLKSFNAALQKGLENIKTVAEESPVDGLTVHEKINYLRNSISYTLDDEKKEGMKLFLELLEEKKLATDYTDLHQSKTRIGL